MQKILLPVIGLIACVGVAGCVSIRPTAEESQMALRQDWTYPADYQQAIKSYWHSRLIDPASPLYEFSEPRKGYLTAGLLSEEVIIRGWIVDYTLNAKSGMGEYTGREARQAVVVGDKVLCDSMINLVFGTSTCRVKPAKER
jgi:hypothetical protein